MTIRFGAFVVIAVGLFAAGLLAGFIVNDLLRGRKFDPILLIPLGMEAFILAIYFQEVNWL